MDVTDPEMLSHDEVDSPLHPEHHLPKSNTFSSLGRQTSIYTLTLDELQNTVCESGKNFGSMNMDEFLNSIWTAEENHAQAHAHTQGTSTMPAAATNIATASQLSISELNPPTDHKGISRQTSLTRQGSLSIPAPLSRKTVDEVWAEIHRTQQLDQHVNAPNLQNQENSTRQRQLTFGEMTLEDFLVRAGVVREQCQPAPLPIQQQPYVYPANNAPLMGASFTSRPVMNLSAVGGGRNVNIAPVQLMAQTGVCEAPNYAGTMKRGAAYPHETGISAPPSYGGRIGNGSGAPYVQAPPLAVASPVSPVSPDGLCNQADGGHPYGMDMGGIRGGRKRILDGPIEKVVERRQRRMIKNRESAARSRARKQAYTVELEAELNQLKEENSHLKQLMAEMERKRRQQMEETRTKAEGRTQKTFGRLRRTRRSSSCPL